MAQNNKNSNKAITFYYKPEQDVKTVCLSGDFNEWDPNGIRMVRRNGLFCRRLSLPQGDHQYKFIVDGHWQADPEAPKQVPNELGSMNSVITTL